MQVIRQQLISRAAHLWQTQVCAATRSTYRFRSPTSLPAAATVALWLAWMARTRGAADAAPPPSGAAADEPEREDTGMVLPQVPSAEDRSQDPQVCACVTALAARGGGLVHHHPTLHSSCPTDD